MGSWNKTCGLSNLHIYAGSPVYVFVLEEGRDKTERCYSTAFWSPLLVPFESKYNDYGGGEESGGAAFELIMGAIANNLTEMDVGENKYHDIAVKQKGFGEEQFFDAVHENRLFHRRGGSIDFVMFRKDIVDHILENNVIEHYVGGNKGNCGWNNNYIKYKFSDVIADIPEFLDVFEGALKTSKEGLADDAFSFQMALHMSGGFDRLFEYGHSNKVSWYMRGDSYRYSRLLDTNAELTTLMNDGKRTEAEELLKVMLIGRYLDSFMECTRHNWGPGGHEGSQSNDADSHRSLVGAITRALDVEKADRGEDDVDTDVSITDYSI